MLTDRYMDSPDRVQLNRNKGRPYHLQIFCLHILDDLREESTDVLANSHVGNNALDCILATVAVFTVQLCEQLCILAYFE